MSARPCGGCGDVLPETVHASPEGRFWLCSRAECGQRTYEPAEERHARLTRELAAAEGRVTRLIARLDGLDLKTRRPAP